MVSRRYWQFDADDPTGAPAPRETQDYLLRCLLGARKEASFPSNEGGFDEDVNVYLAGLLNRFFSASYHDEARRYLQPYDLDLRRQAEASGDPRYAYRLYKVNADHLLLGIGIFHHVEGALGPEHPFLHRDPSEFEGRGSLYYLLASSRLHHLKRRRGGIGEALRKLGERFPRYVQVLRHVRSDYFDLMERIGEGSLFHLGREIEEMEPQAHDRTTLYDAFLDCYSRWKEEPSPVRHEALKRAVARLRKLDPRFRFEMPAAPAEDPGETARPADGTVIGSSEEPAPDDRIG